MLSDLLKHEIELFNQGIKYIAGVDEVGRGPLAGPLVACAVILDLESIFRNNDVSSQENMQYEQIKDSKKISENKRVSISKFIKSVAIDYSIFEITSQELDEIGISACIYKVFAGAVNKLKIQPEFILTDFVKISGFSNDKQMNFIRGEDESISIAAASIVAKVCRDEIMINEHEKYPIYGFDRHKGYGTKEHYEKLKLHGPCEIHRKSFRLG